MNETIVLLFAIPVTATLLAVVACLMVPSLIRAHFADRLFSLMVIAFVIPGSFGSGLLAWNLTESAWWMVGAVLLGSIISRQLADLVNRLLQRILYR